MNPQPPRRAEYIAWLLVFALAGLMLCAMPQRPWTEFEPSSRETQMGAIEYEISLRHRQAAASGASDIER